MFNKEVYKNRRQRLHKLLKGNGIVLFPGNDECAMNYRANTYRYRQDSSFLYYFGLNQPGLAAICDLDSGKDTVYGNDLEIDDIIWMGEHPSMKDLAALCAADGARPMADLTLELKKAIAAGRKVQILPTYRGDTVLWLAELCGLPTAEIKNLVSEELIRAVVEMRSIKDAYEIEEIEKAVEVAYMMHTTAMKMGYPGNMESELAGTIEGIALSGGGAPSFPIILSMDGQTLHNHYHGNELSNGRLVVTDAGAETAMGYASDITRTFPVGGKFTTKQKEVYEIVLAANMKTIEAAAPGVSNKELHLLAARTIAEGLSSLGLMKGNINEIVASGAHALFFPHGLGHMLGLDVHDMENLGENYVGYDHTVSRSEQFGTAYLRLAKAHKPGFVFTIEPGIYFIPSLIGIWRKEKRFEQFISYSKLEAYMDFGGIRIEDDVLITENGHKVLGRPIPKTVDEVEETMR